MYVKIQSTEVLFMKTKYEKHFLTIDRNEINSYIGKRQTALHIS